MSLNVDWEKLRVAYQDLVQHSGISEQTDIIFVLILTSGKAKKAVVKFKDFMTFFWSLAEDKKLHVTTLIVQDKEGRVLYRHKQRTSGGDEIPDGGHSSIVLNWGALNADEKNLYIEMLIAQIKAHEQTD